MTINNTYNNKEKKVAALIKGIMLRLSLIMNANMVGDKSIQDIAKCPTHGVPLTERLNKIGECISNNNETLLDMYNRIDI